MAARESIAELKKRAGRVSRALAKLYPKARISLDFETPWQCLAATILSAQSTDAGVNRVTPRLFKEYPDARAMAAADARHVEELIVKTGFFRQKTRSLMGAARKIVEDYGGEVPVRDGSARENSGRRAQDGECDSRAYLRQAGDSSWIRMCGG